MKKILTGMISFLLLFVIIGCSSKTNNSPEEVAKNYLNGFAEQNFEEMDKYSIVEYEKIHRPMIEAAMREYSKTESQVYEMLLRNEDVTDIPTNYEEYAKKYVEIFKEQLKEEYGENYSIEATILSSTDIDEEDKEKMLDEASDYYDRYNVVISDIVDFSKISEIKKMQCKIYMTGTEETTEKLSIYVVKTNDEWKVLNIGTGS